jgi:catechol 2,3-dioxygenase-like lactoylglutathione lyase family enzyme
MSDGIAPLGIDNVLFVVGDLGAAVRFYGGCGLTLKFRVDGAGMALFAIGDEAPGLLLRRGEGDGGGRLWVEVADAGAAAARLAAAGVATTRLETATGITVEAADPSGNVIGFADYTKRPEMARR